MEKSKKEGVNNMMTQLLEYAETENIAICDYPLRKKKSLSICLDDLPEILLDEKQIETRAEYKMLLIKEIGHCKTNAFVYDNRGFNKITSKQEYRALRWSINHFLPKEKVYNAIKKGHTEVWQLAEYFDVTEDLIKFALWVYFDINL